MGRKNQLNKAELKSNESLIKYIKFNDYIDYLMIINNIHKIYELAKMFIFQHPF